jgi:two-component system, OmpR family, phosphate regulon sensor histidine kinase PhoR
LLKSVFFRRLFLPYLLLICVSIGIVGIIGAQRLHRSHIETVERSLEKDSELITHILRGKLTTEGSSEFSDAVNNLSRGPGWRITVIRADGAVIADTEADPAKMENHRLRPEIIAAASQGTGSSIRPSGTVREDLMYFARRIEGADGQHYFIRLAVHLRELDRELREFYLGIALAAAFAMLAAGILCYVFARRHAAPLVELTQFADAVRQGDLTRRIVRKDEGEIGTLATSLDSMASSLSRMIAETRQDRAQLLAMLSSMSEGVIAIDPAQRIVLANGAAGHLLGFRSNESVGRLLWEVVRHEAVLRKATDVLRTRESSNIQVGPIAGRHLDITICTFSASDVADALVIVLHDVTQSVRYQELRKEFVANVSHELRTPLTAIKGFAETLRESALGDPQRAPQFLATIEKHADQLTNLVSDLLQLSRLESAGGLPKQVRISVTPLVDRAVDVLRPEANKKRQELHVEIAPHLPALSGDPDYLERAVANLVENAIKYTPEGGEVTVSARQDENEIIIDVTDNGIGIPQADLPRIFERFYRVDRSRSREMGGTGLGLSIVKHIAQAHHGRVEVTSTPGSGSTFRLILPAISIA